MDLALPQEVLEEDLEVKGLSNTNLSTFIRTPMEFLNPKTDNCPPSM